MVRRSCLILIFGLLLVGGDFPVIEHKGSFDDPWILYHSESVAISWDPYPEDTIVKVTAEIRKTTDEDVPPEKTWSVETKIPAGEKGKLFIWDYVKNLEDGSYYFRMKVWNEQGISSPWSRFYYFVKKWKAPEAPGGCVLLR